MLLLLLALILPRAAQAHLAEFMLLDFKLQQPDHHRHGGRGKTPMPTVLGGQAGPVQDPEKLRILAHVAADQRREKRP